MADGNYGGNGSIHWENQYGGNPKTTGSDPTPVNNMGGGTGNFILNLRYSTAAKPINALLQELDNMIKEANAARAQLQKGATDANVRIHVPSIARKSPPTGTPQDPWEVNVHW